MGGLYKQSSQNLSVLCFVILKKEREESLPPYSAPRHMLDVAWRCPLQGEIVPQNCALNATAGMHAHKTKILNLLSLDSAGDGDH